MSISHGPKGQVEVVARFQQIRVLAYPENSDASLSAALWGVEVDRLPIKHADFGLEAAIAGLARAVRAELPESWTGNSLRPRKRSRSAFSSRLLTVSEGSNASCGRRLKREAGISSLIRGPSPGGFLPGDPRGVRLDRSERVRIGGPMRFSLRPSEDSLDSQHPA